MSATLSWASSGAGTKTGTAIGNLFADLVTLITSKAGDAAFSWEVASSNTGSTPYQITLKPKDGSAGRILLVAWSSAPAGNNSAILDAAPTTNTFYGAFFPAGNVNTPSNLTSSSGTIMGDDTGAVKVWASMAIATIYGASIVPFYFDSAEACCFAFQNPAAAQCYFAGAGALVVDSSDNAYNAVLSYAGTNVGTFGTAGSPSAPWQTAAPLAGAATACLRTNYGATNRVYFNAWSPAGPWASSAVSSTDILTDTSNSKAWFVPVQMLGQAKGEGFVLKLRQIGFGPGTVGPLTPYNTTGPVVAARQVNLATAGGNGYPWVTNFKI
jgi:hypothetical protein